jgi:hypothetical protein
VNHAVIGALMFAFGALITFTAASAVQIWAMSRQPEADYNPVVDRVVTRPAYEYRKRSSDCQTPLWPQAGLPSRTNMEQR